jgi:hypothetical protein
MSLSIVQVSSNTNVDSGYNVYLCSSSGGNITLSMPQISFDGEHYYFRNINGVLVLNTITISAFSGDTINGSSTYSLAYNTDIHIVSYGNNWYLIS